VSTELPQRIAILGPGLLGGSLLLALRERMPAAHLRAWGRDAAKVSKLAAMKLDGALVADVASTDLSAVVDNAQLVVLCTPVATMPAQARELATLPVAPGCIVTDVGSVKTSVVVPLEQIFARTALCFIGSHPMAGSEFAGMEHASASLFQDATCLLTPTLLTAAAALHTARAFWKLLGCTLLEMSPEEHDRKVARISHLPRLAASIVTLAALHDDPSAADCMGNGFRDTAIRIASGDPELWTGIVAANRAEVLAAARDARDRFNHVVSLLETSDDKALTRFFSDAKSLRDKLL
jgi:prephenate dehydrogenase